MPASVPSPYQVLYRFNYSPLLLLPGSLARIIYRRASQFLIKLLWNMGKADEKEVAVKRSLGGAKYFIAPSIAHCDWVVYKPMGHWLLAVPAWWSSLANINNNKKTFCRPLKCVGPPGKCPVCPIANPALVSNKKKVRKFFRAAHVRCNTIIALGLKFDWQLWIPNRIRVLTICSLIMAARSLPYMWSTLWLKI